MDMAFALNHIMLTPTMEMETEQGQWRLDLLFKHSAHTLFVRCL